ncbi:uncharacterized protein LOC141686227 [Apium graveolens]|uniref:uncharacterized protein LOC141686227 n=1 Tax=Apium graveolens TaxID=4045 RepID=UPI003D7B1DE0
MGESNENSTYLCLPNILGRKKSVILGYLKDRACSQVNKWNGKCISSSGKEVLIKTTAQALPTYAMNVFLLPQDITNHIEKTLASYWWKTSQNNNSRLNWMSWERMTRHKSSGGMGFRDFRDFNIAMLGKQGWRFASNPGSLVTRVYKAREWDLDIRKDIFNVRDQEAILNTVLNDNGEEDVLYWKHEVSGQYSVKSAYRWIQQNKGAWEPEDKHNIWSKLWKIKAPPKAINVIMNQFSTSWCTALMLAYAGHSLMLMLRWGLYSDFKTWMENVMNVADAKKKAVIITICWALWRNRNDLVWNQRHASVNKTVAAAKQLLSQWSLAQNRSTSALLQPALEGDEACIWVNPQQNTVKVTVDAAVFEDKDAMGFGLITRDSDGALIQAKSIIHKNSVSPVLAEAMAIKEALSWIDEMHWQESTVVSDCQVVVQAIRRP